MNGICIGLAFGLIQSYLPLERFTLAWDHTVEKIRWEEDYRVVPGGLELTEARIRGQGAGMEVPDGAVWRAGSWHYRPRLPVLEKLAIARAASYQLCRDGTCAPLAQLLPAGNGAERVEIRPCAGDSPPAGGPPRSGLPSGRGLLE